MEIDYLNNTQNKDVNKNNYNEIQSEINDLLELGKKTKISNIDFFIEGSYCDSVDETKKWCVAEIIRREGDLVTIHFEGWSDKHNDTIHIKRAGKIAPFRKYSKYYTGQTKQAFRKYVYNDSDYLVIKGYIRKIIDSNFTCFESANEATQILRGRIFTFIDIFMTTIYNQNSPKAVPLIVDLLYDYIDLVICYLEYYTNNAYLYDALVKYPDLFLVNVKCAIIAALPEISFTLKRIFGVDNRTNEFYRTHDVIIKKIKAKSNQKFCLDNFYKQSSEKDGFSIICIVNFIDYFYSKGGLKLIMNAVTLQREFQAFISSNNVNKTNDIGKNDTLSTSLSKSGTINILESNSNSTLVKQPKKPNSLINVTESPLNNNSSFVSSQPLPPVELEFKVPLFALSPFINILVDTDSYLSKKTGFDLEYLKIQEVIKLRLNFLTSIEIKELKKQVVCIIATMLKNLISTSDKKLSQVIYEDILLIFYWKCFTSKILSKRINGITCLSNVVVALEKKDRREFTPKENKTEEEVLFEALNSTTLIKFLLERQVPDIVMGESIHEEVVRKSFSIFKYLANFNALSGYHFEVIWRNYTDKHESIAKQVEALICQISQYLNTENKILLFEKIKNNFKETAEYVELVKGYTIGCLGNLVTNSSSEEKLFFGIPMLWNYICSSNNKEFVEVCVEKFSEIFVKLSTIDDSVKEKYLKYCFSNIQNNIAVIPSIKLIQKLMSDLIDGSKFPKPVSKIIKSCDDQFKISLLFISSLKRYKDTVKAALNADGAFSNKMNIDIISSEDTIKDKLNDKNDTNNTNNLQDSIKEPMQVVYEGLYNHKENIEVRLEVLNYLLSEKSNIYTIQYNFEIVEELWNVLVKEATFNQERLLFFRFLIMKSNEPIDNSKTSFVQIISEELFKKIICNKNKFNVESPEFCIMSFNLFKKFFITVNLNLNKLVEDPMKIRVATYNLLGLDFIIDILCYSKNEKVKELSAAFLMNMTLSLHTFTEEFTKKYWGSVLNLILTQLSNCIETHNEYGIQGILIYLNKLIASVSDEGDIPDSNHVSFAQEGVDMKFVHPKLNETRTSKVSSRDKVMNVRLRMAYYWDIPYNKCTLVSSTSKKVLTVSDDFKVFRELISTSDVVEVHESNHPILKMKSNPKTMILANNELYNTLYLLLNNYNSSYISICSDLIRNFSMNKELEAEIISCTNLEKILITESSYKLNYNLDLLKQVFVNSNTNNMSGKLFFEKKGVFYLIEILRKIDFTCDLAYSTITNLISLIMPLFSTSQNTQVCSLESLFTYIDKKELASILIKTLNSLINKCYEFDTSSKYISDQERHISMKEKNIIRNNPSEIEDFTASINDEKNFLDSLLIKWSEHNEAVLSLVNFVDVIDIQNELISSITSLEENIKTDVDYNTSFRSIYLNILITGLLKLKNFKVKDTLSNFILSLISFSASLNQEVKQMNKNENKLNDNKIEFPSDELKNLTFTVLLEKENLINGVLANIPQSSKFLSIINNLLECCFNSFETSKLQIDYLQSAVNSMLKFIDEFKFSYQKRNICIAIEGYLKIIKVILLKIDFLKSSILKQSENNSGIDIVDLLLRKCVLSKCQTNPLNEPFPKCFGSSCIQAAYDLLAVFTYRNKEITLKIIEEINQYFNTGFWKGKKLLDWKIDLKQESKSLTGYTGLVNLSCTCYMNSLLQQFYNIPSIRESILVAKELENGKHNVPINSSLYQLKAIFASLKAFESKAYNPKDFCINFDNQLLNVTEQMDVDEFFNMLLDKLEIQLKDSCYSNPFYYEFGGSISNDIICKDCPHRSEREEGFNCIILSVKNSIQEALGFYIQEEILEGENAYICEKCDKKVNALRRACIKTLPRTLILVLKRFEFDYDMNQKLKLNNYCEFPKELDMQPYLQEYLNSRDANSSNANDVSNNNNLNSTNNNNSTLINSSILVESEETNESEGNTNFNKVPKPKEFYMYDLSGIIIHTGTVENGHYYSIIKTTDINDNNNKTWLEFNDSNVKPYDFDDDIANEAYGGTETIINKDNNKEVVEKPSSAYVLFYKRRIEETSELKKYQKIYENKYIEEIVKTSNSLNKSSSMNNNYNNSAISQTTNISQTLLDKVNEDNFKYWVSKNLFNEQFIKFVINVLVNFNYNQDYLYLKNDTKNLNYLYFQYTNQHILNNYSFKKQSSPSVTNNKSSSFKQLGIRSSENLDNSNLVKFLESYSCCKKTVNELNEEGLSQNNSDSVDEEKMFKFACLTYFNIVARAKEKQFIPVFTDLIKLFINKNTHNAKFLLEEFSHIDVLNEYIIDNPVYEMRSLIVGVLNCAMIKFFNSEIKAIISNNKNITSSETKSNIYSNSLCRLTNSLLFAINKYTYLEKQEMKDLTHVYLLILKFTQLGNGNTTDNVVSTVNNVIPDYNLTDLEQLYSKNYLKEIGFLDYLLDIIFNKPQNSNTTNTKDGIKDNEVKLLSEIVNKLEIETKHKILSTKFMNKVDKLTNIEEILEKKQIEKVISSKHDQYLFMTLIEILCCSKLDSPNKTNKLNKCLIDSEENKLLLDYSTLKKVEFESSNFILTLLSEVKIKPTSVLVSKLILQMCYNNPVTTSIYIDCYKKLLHFNDFFELDGIMRCLKSFLLIDDSLSTKRVKDTINMLIEVFTDNMRYYKFTEYLIDYFLKMFTTRRNFLQYIEAFKPLFTKMLKWLKDNTYPPHFTPSKTCEMFKKKSHSFPNNTNPQLINNFINKHQQLNSEKQGKISDLYKNYDSELDLTDFKFSVGDRVKVDGINAVIIKVLDEMIQIEFDKQEIAGTKRPEVQWVDTESKLLELVFLKEVKSIVIENTSKSKLYQYKKYLYLSGTRLMNAEL